MKSLNRIMHKVYNSKWLILPSMHRQYVSQLNAIMTGKAGMPDTTQDDCDEEAKSITNEPEIIGNIQIIRIDGTIGKHLSMMEMECGGGVDLDSINAQIEMAKDNPNITKVVFLINSAGGTTTGVQETGEMINELSKEKECIAYTDTLCASAAYWLASQCNSVYCSPSSIVGSIGVYCLVLDETQAMAMDGLAINVFKAGKYKISGASFLKMTDEEKKMFQDDVDKTYEQFKSVVKAKRNINDEDMEGLTFDGTDAVEKGYCDGLINTPQELIKFLQLNH